MSSANQEQITIFDVRGVYCLRGSFYRPETMCYKKIVLKTKSIVMRTTNNVFRKVHNCTHFKLWFTQFEQKCSILEIFHYFQYFERFRLMKKRQISKPKIVDWYLDFSKESYTKVTLPFMFHPEFPKFSVNWYKHPRWCLTSKGNLFIHSWFIK